MARMTTPEDGSLPAFQKTIPTVHRLDHSQAQRVLWALEELHASNGLKYHYKNYPRVQPKNPDLLEVSPLGKSPILTVEDLKGRPVPNIQVVDGVVMETQLILEFLGESYGGKDLWEPETAEERLRDRYFRSFATGTMVERVDQAMLFTALPKLMPFPLKQIFGLLFIPLEKAFRAYLVDFFDFMESQLSVELPYFAGKKLGIADFCLEFPMSMAVCQGFLDGKKYPKIRAWHDTITSREAYKKAIEKGGGKEKYDLVSFGAK
ncbi:uncharacterized protein PV09_04999 [Verruconis gallopava]|uniref:GST C-terminal domain-containing protein n=1 Tax=Verruconis gallopava TaxID=253628 RepID=A0A0D2AA90_9PEZI|nr:uncharacterized protein PV09_04999 [Verruconis gallopava]KIW03678.1 hypothetical protein PV09_04999 [Verruconis gallopava]